MNIDKETELREQKTQLPRQTLTLPPFKKVACNTFASSGQSELGDTINPYDIPCRNILIQTSDWTTAEDKGDTIYSQVITNRTVYDWLSTDIANTTFRNFLTFSFDLLIYLEMQQTVQHAGMLVAGVFQGDFLNSNSNLLTPYFSPDINRLRLMCYHGGKLISPQFSEPHVFKVPLLWHGNKLFGINRDFDPSNTASYARILDYPQATLAVAVLSPLNTVANVTSLPIRITRSFVNFRPSDIIGGNLPA